MNQRQALLQVNQLSVEFPTRRGTLRAVDQASFDIAPGEVLGVVGESGAGKSLTGAAIVGLLAPPGRIAGGSVHLDGERIDNLPAEALRRIRGRRIGDIPGSAHFAQSALHDRRAIGGNDTHAPRRLFRRGATTRNSAARRSGYRRRATAHRSVPAPIFRRDAAARGDRARVVREP